MSENDRSGFDRREFLQAGATVAAASAMTLGAGSTGQADDAAKTILPKRKLGKTGAEVTILNVGTGGWRGNASAPQLLRTAYANGIRYLDTANAYGTEPAICNFFKAVPEAKKDTFIVTKDKVKSVKQLIPLLDKRLETLQVDSVDAYFLHGLGDDHPELDTCLEILKSKEFKETADAIRKSGKAKFFGFSVHHAGLAEMVTTAAEMGVVDMIMVKYNAFALKDHPFNKALDAAHAKGIGLISMKQLAGSETALKDMSTKLPSLKDKGLKPYEMLLHAIWTDERISSCCVSLKNTDQIIEGVHAARNFEPLKAAELEEIHQFFLASGPTLCALCDGSCSRAGGTDAALGDLTRFLTYHEHHGERAEARRQYANLTDAAKNWKDADLVAARAACPSHLNFSELLPKVDDLLA
jgi:predicted aldo/keto reductase-like oxidoreductase